MERMTKVYTTMFFAKTELNFYSFPGSLLKKLNKL